MEKITILVFFKYQNRESWCGMGLLSQKGSIIFAAKKATQMDGKIKEPRWDEVIVSEFQNEQTFEKTLERLAKENRIKYYRIVLIDPYPRERTQSLVNPSSITYTDKTIVILNFLKYYKKANYSEGEKRAGRDVYKKYGRDFVKFLAEYGGRLEYGGKIKSTIVEVSQPFDFSDFSFVSYPSMEKLFEMATGKKWQQASKHRSAGLKDTTVLKVKPYNREGTSEVNCSSLL